MMLIVGDLRVRVELYHSVTAAVQAIENGIVDVAIYDGLSYVEIWCKESTKRHMEAILNITIGGGEIWRTIGTLSVIALNLNASGIYDLIRRNIPGEILEE